MSVEGKARIEKLENKYNKKSNVQLKYEAVCAGLYGAMLIKKWGTDCDRTV